MKITATDSSCVEDTHSLSAYLSSDTAVYKFAGALIPDSFDTFHWKVHCNYPTMGSGTDRASWWKGDSLDD